MLFLASRSPQRSELLMRAGIDFEVVASTGDEESISIPHPQAQATERARIKAEGAVFDQIKPRWEAGDAILAADTVVAVGTTIFGKPKDDADAIRILQHLSGTTHTVTTAHCLMIPQSSGSPLAAVAVSLAQITMRPLEQAEIEAYVASGESQGRAGAYAIQEHGDAFIAERTGAFDTVVGLHVSAVRRLYYECTGNDLACTDSTDPWSSGTHPLLGDGPA